VVSPRRLVAVNITRSQFVAGHERLTEAGAAGVIADAMRLPFAHGSFDGVISVEAAFHFPSRARFFSAAFRVLRPSGVLSMWDIATYRYPRGPRELLAALSQLRVRGLGTHAAATPVRIAAQAEAAGFVDVHVDLVGGARDRAGPALRAPATRAISRERLVLSARRAGHDRAG
jgi:SAM-dependent methyltransferase